MPISKLLPDGRVEIFNSKTGERKTVAPEELAQYNPALIGAYEQLVKEQQDTQAQVQLAEQGALDPAKLAESNPQALLNALKSGTKMKEKGKDRTQSEKTNANLAKTGAEALSKVEELLEKDPSLLAKQKIPGKFQSRTFDSALFNAVDTLLRIRTGATAPEQEIRRYMGSLGPNFGDKPEDVDFKLNQLRTALINEGGLTEEEVAKVSPKKAAPVQPTPPMQGSIVDQQPPEGIAVQTAKQRLGGQPQPNDKGIGLLGELLAPVAQGPVGEGADAFLSLIAPSLRSAADKSGRREAVSGDLKLGAAGDLISTTLPFAKVGLLGKLGMAGRSAIAGGISGATGEGQSGSERVMSGGVQALLGGLLGGIPQGVGAAKKSVSLKHIGATRDAAIESSKRVKFSGDQLAKAAKEYVENDPMAQNVLKKVLPSIEGRSITLPNLMKKIDVWNDAYTQAGRVGKSAEAGLNNVLAQKAKELVAKKAPAVTDANKKFSRAYTAKDIGKTAIKWGAGAAGIGLGGDVISRLLLGRD